MLINKKLKTYSITLLLVISVFSFLFVSIDTAEAASSNQTVLYFHDYFTNGTIDTNEPTKSNASAWPPQKLLSDKGFEWVRYWGELYFYELTFSSMLGDPSELDLDDYSAVFGDLMPSPLEITETYYYDGEDDLTIKGNVAFDLYFSSRNLNKLLSVIPESYWKSDHVEVTINANDQSYNKTSKIDLKLLQGKIQKMRVLLENVDFELEPGDDITFSVEVIPGDKIVSFLIENFVPEDIIEDTVSKFAKNTSEWLTNDSQNPYVKQFLDLLLNRTIPGLNSSSAGEALYGIVDLFDLMGQENISIMEVITAFWDDSFSSSFIYDSVNYKSSVILPVSLPGDDENLKTYYLHANAVMDESIPEDVTEEEVKLSKDNAEWVGPDLPRSKILTDATAYLYLHYWDVWRLFNRDHIKLTCTLLNGEEEITSVTKELSKTTLLNIITKPSEPTAFTFDLPEGSEISYDEDIALKVSTNDTNFGLNLGLNSQIKLLYGSETYPSSLSLVFDETDHIQISDVSTDRIDDEIVAGGSIVYSLNITSDYDDIIEIDYLDSSFSEEEAEKWDIELPDDLEISAGEQKTVEIVVSSEEFNLDAYGDVLDIIFTVSGKTGKDMHEAIVEISSDAVDHDVIITAPEEVEIKHGYNETYYFVIRNNNTGLWPESYEIDASSEHDFEIDLEYDEDELDDLEADGEVQINVTIHIPKYTNISEDKITFVVESKESDDLWTAEVTVLITTPNVLEKIFEFFENAADSLGFYDIFGDYAPHALVTIILVVIFFVLIITAALITRKFIELVCLDRIKEITTDEEAVYEITIKNPSNYSLNYELAAEEVEPSPGFEVTLDTKSVLVESKQEQTIFLKVKPTDFARPDDWIEVKIIANIPEKNKSEEISTVTTIKDADSDVEMSGVVHWPKKFKAGEVVKTSFKLRNNGNAAATDVTVILYVNGEEKNKVEGITIPRGGYADIEIPWVAVKGKNDIDIEVK